MKNNIGFNTFFLYTLLCSFTIQTRAIPYNYMAQQCDQNTTSFTPNSTYQSNLKTVFSLLTSNATNTPTGFYNSSAGINPPDVAYGAFLCRGDVSSGVCSDCVLYATQVAPEKCGLAKVATIWYEDCMIRYSNESFFGIKDASDVIFFRNEKSATGPKHFKDVLDKTLDDVAKRAKADDRTGKKFAVSEVNPQEFEKLYTMAQCTPDLNSIQCDQCLRQCINYIARCCSFNTGARILYPSCNFRYEPYPFYDFITAVAPPPSPSLPLNPPSPPPPPPPPPAKGKPSKKILIAIIVPTVASLLLFIIGFCLLTRRRKSITKTDNSVTADNDGGNDITTEHSLQYDLGTIQTATNNFSLENKIGEGGYGSVYKGELSNGQEIAVKRLSQSSGQGALEFKNEVVVVAKLQHRNLVRLRGFCLEGEEKILIYEFLPNKSLDYIIFDPQRSSKLDWPIRYKIIGGIARGMLYLHEDSRLRIIHRDLKASNVLLDADMNAKVSDFGMAKIFGGDQTQGSTSRVVGTFGYMSPEYVIHGRFSVKSDVFSFGVLLLEIVTGKSNGSFYDSDGGEDLLSYAWKLWKKGNHLDMVVPVLEGSYSNNEVTRCIHIGLLCVQEDVDSRPTMATVVMMLNCNSANLSAPQEPPFFSRGRSSWSMPNMT